jgi:chromosome segregation ATPase
VNAKEAETALNSSKKELMHAEFEREALRIKLTSLTELTFSVNDILLQKKKNLRDAKARILSIPQAQMDRLLNQIKEKEDAVAQIQHSIDACATKMTQVTQKVNELIALRDDWTQILHSSILH